MKQMLALWLVTFSLCAVDAVAAEKRAPAAIDSGALTKDLQRMSNDDGITLAWWVPVEFWEASFAREKSASAEQLEQFMKTLRPYSLLAVVDGRANGGNIAFSDRAAVAKALTLEVVDARGKKMKLPVIDPIPGEMVALLAMITPSLAAAMGNLGENLHFFVFQDETADGRVLSPYDAGSLIVTYAGGEKRPDVALVIDRPVDALFVPRMCPNGKPAHVTWKFCPWDGSKLK